MSFKMFLIAGLTALVAVFVLQNTAVVEIRFLFWTVSMSRALMIVFVLFTGMALSWLLRGYLSRRRRK